MNTPIRRATACTALVAAALSLTACFAPPAVIQTPKPPAEPVVAGGGDGGEPTSTPTGVPIDGGDIPDAPGGFVAVFDDTQHLGALVPDTWTDVGGTGWADGDGREWISLQAAEDLEEWDHYWGEPGLLLAAAELYPDWDELDVDMEIYNLSDYIIDSFDFEASCTTVKDTETYSDQIYSGVISTFEDCPSDSMAVVLAAYDREAFTHEIYFELTLPGGLDDEKNVEILEQLTNSFQASFDDTKASRS